MAGCSKPLDHTGAIIRLQLHMCPGQGVRSWHRPPHGRAHRRCCCSSVQGRYRDLRVKDSLLHAAEEKFGGRGAGGGHNVTHQVTPSQICHFPAHCYIPPFQSNISHLSLLPTYWQVPCPGAQHSLVSPGTGCWSHKSPSCRSQTAASHIMSCRRVRRSAAEKAEAEAA